MEERLKFLVSEIFNLDPTFVDGSMTRDNTETWDSLNHINLIVALEQEFGVSFDVNEIEAISSFEDVREILEAKLPS